MRGSKHHSVSSTGVVVHPVSPGCEWSPVNGIGAPHVFIDYIQHFTRGRSTTQSEVMMFETAPHRYRTVWVEPV